MPAACSDHAHESCRTPQTRESSVRARAEPSARSPCSLRVSTLPSLLNLMLPHGSRVPLVYPLRTTCLMLHLFRVHTKCPDTCNLHASE